LVFHMRKVRYRRQRGRCREDCRRCSGETQAEIFFVRKAFIFH
jgi:hypothetical protein